MSRSSKLGTTALIILLPFRVLAADSCLHRTVTVGVEDNQGTVVNDLRAQSFRATVSGHPVTVSSAAFERVPRIVLVLDASESITEENDRAAIARIASEDMITSSPAATRVGLVLFAGDVLDTLDFKHSPQDVFQRVKQLEAEKIVPEGKGKTALWDSVSYAMGLFGPPTTGDSIYVITDSGDNKSHLGPSHLERMLLEKGIRVFALILGTRYFRTQEERTGADTLSHIVRVSGGNLVNLLGEEGQGKEHLRNALRRMYEQLGYFYSINLTLSMPSDKESKLHFEVVDEQGGKRKDLRLMYPARLAACPN